jgi:putative transposase
LARERQRIHRLYGLEGLQMRFKPRRRRVMAQFRDDGSSATGPNQVSAMDWMHDELFDLTSSIRGGESVPMWVYRAATATEVTDARSASIEASSRRKNSVFGGYANRVTLDFSPPGKPTDYAYVESFNATARSNVWVGTGFPDLDDAGEKIEEWRTECNEVRPIAQLVTGRRCP